MIEEIDYKKIFKVEIEHEYFNYSSVLVCDINDYIDSLNYFMKHNVKIIAIRFYERKRVKK